MRRAAAVAIVALLWAPVAARANAWDLYGFGPRAMGMGGAFTAVTDDFTASYYNPAGLTSRRKVHFGLGLLLSFPALTIERSRSDPTRPNQDPPAHYGATVGVVFPLGAKIDNRLALGVSLYVPLSGLFRLDAVDHQTPQFYMYQSLAEKLVIAPALGVRLSDFVSVGLGLQILADLIGHADISADLVNRRITRRNLRVDLGHSAAATAGLMVGPFAGVRFGVSWRGALALDYRLPATLDLESVGALALDIYGVAGYTPHQINFGVAWELPGKKVRLAFDLVWARWSGAPDPSTKIDLDARGDIIDKLGLGEALDFRSPKLPLGATDTWTPRVGVEWSLAENWVLRGGYFFRPTPIPKQNGFTNYLDNDAHGLSAGFAWTHPDFLEVHRNPVTLELALLTLLLPNRAVQKAQAGDPVGDLQSRGAVFSLSVSVRHDF